MTEAPTPLRVKICGVTRNRDARLAERMGATHVGVIVSGGFSRSLAEGAGARVLDGVGVARVAVTVDAPIEAHVASARALGADVLQLHGDETSETVASLRDAGAWAVWKAVRARELDDLRRAVDVHGDGVDAFLVEGWRAGAKGGAGLVLRLDPDAVRSVLPDGVDFVLAGGLDPDGVAEAVARYRPDVVDVSSGVEAAVGQKDPARVDAFIRAARGATVPLTDRTSDEPATS